MNPFEQKVRFSRPGTYKAYVEECVTAMAVDESKQVAVKINDRSKFRMCLNKLGDQMEMKFSTLVDADGNMWIKRVE